MSNKRCYNLNNTTNELEEPNAINSNYDNDNNHEDNEDDSDYLEDVPYSSAGSIGRSSIGSIPWADDAIKQNQMAWEQVERMLSGEEPLPTEPDLRNEILEWQEKFPQLLGKKIGVEATQNNFAQENYRTMNITRTFPDDLISHLSLNSSSDDELGTPTAKKQLEKSPAHKLTNKADSSNTTYDKLSAKMSLLRVTALPLHLSHRSNTSSINVKLRQHYAKEEREYSAALKSLSLQKISTNIPQSHKSYPNNKQHLSYYTQAKTQPQRYCMPPIINVLESKNRFRDMSSDKSFVQLTHIKSPHHTKSAAIIRQTDFTSPLNGPQKPQRATPTLFISGDVRSKAVPLRQHQALWQKPSIATRINSNFFNNRNTIVLPALDTQRISAQQQRRDSRTSTSTGETSTRTYSLSNSKIGLSPSSSANQNLRPHCIADRFVSKWQQLNTANHLTSTSPGNISKGRSISAAIRPNPRAIAGDGYSELYVPSYTHLGYNKHDSFK
ncbi:uncharacterized protein [Eurosta solidaginis]|uniref:uncharacterized protein n=1 Tax=Eurosta solidaginis TaxID=178769 RepID=UPI003531238E